MCTMKKLFNKITQNNRSQKLKINIALSFIIKIFSIGISLILVPIVLNYLGKTNYGIWAAITALANWFVFFDFGLGNGLRNKLSEALAKKNFSLGKEYISTTYFIVNLIFFVLFVIFLIFSQFINWQIFFNASLYNEGSFTLFIIIVFGLIFIRFVAQLIKNVFYAYQMPVINDFMNLVGQVLILVFFLILSSQNDHSLFKAAIIYTGSPLISIFVFSFMFFALNAKLRPSLKAIKLNLIKNILILGSGFLIIQASAVLFKTTIPILINYFMTPSITAEYTISLKYFNVLTVFSTALFIPFWSAVTEAYVKNDKDWIKKAYSKLQFISLGFALTTIIMFYAAPYIFSYWIENITINQNIILIVGLYVSVFIATKPIILFLNGVGAIREQVIISIIIIITIIPIQIFLFKFLNFGILSFVLPPILFRLFRSAVGYKKLLTTIK